MGFTVSEPPPRAQCPGISCSPFHCPSGLPIKSRKPVNSSQTLSCHTTSYSFELLRSFISVSRGAYLFPPMLQLLMLLYRKNRRGKKACWLYRQTHLRMEPTSTLPLVGGLGKAPTPGSLHFFCFVLSLRIGFRIPKNIHKTVLGR